MQKQTATKKYGIPRMTLQYILLENAGETRRVGKHWLKKFFHRHPDLKALQGIRVDSEHAKGVAPEYLRRLFDTLEGPFIKSIHPQNRYNFDESGLMEGHGSNGKVVGPAQKAGGRRICRALVRRPGKKTWTTIIETINAEGNFLPPVIIFKGQTVQAQWFPTNLDEFSSWQFTASPNG
jgi:hypothetical protein